MPRGLAWGTESVVGNGSVGSFLLVGQQVGQAKWGSSSGLAHTTRRWMDSSHKGRLLGHAGYLTSLGGHPTRLEYTMNQTERSQGGARTADCGGELRVRIWSRVGQLSEAIEALDLQVQQGSYVEDSVFFGLLKRCRANGDLVLGSRIHALAVRSGYEVNKFLANHIICMYASYGRLEEAMQAFNKVPVPSRYMWASIILAHAQHGQPVQAIRLFQQMREESTVEPDNHIFAAVLQACGTADDLSSGRKVHADILGTTCNFSLFVGTCLVDMYAKCGSLVDARRVFDNLPTKDVVTWNAMIAGYAQHGLAGQSLTLYASMQQEGVTSPDSVTFVCLLQACVSVRDLHQGKCLHRDIQDKTCQADLVVGNSLVDMYSKCESMDNARKVFDKMPVKNVVTWTAMIAGYARCGRVTEARRLFDNSPSKTVVTWNSMIAGYTQHGHGQEALALYGDMQPEVADPVTFVCLLQACASVGALHQGKQLHAQIHERGLEADLIVGNSLVNMYAKCGNLQDAQEVFNNLQNRDIMTWNALIAGYAQNGLGQEALTLYRSMLQKGLAPVNVTFVCLLQACASVGALQEGRELHAQIEQRGLEGSAVVRNCLINMYGKCGSLENARKVFDSLPTRDVVTWNTMLAAYVQHGLGNEALTLYGGMQTEGIVSADAVTFLCLLQACSGLAGLEKGKAIHLEITKTGLAGTDLLLANALVDMYGKCGSMIDAQQVFDEMPIRDIVTWTALIAGYARLAQSDFVFDYFQRMIHEGIEPNGITFLSILTVCSHVGLLNKGQEFFDAMGRTYGIAPTIEHFCCMIDLLSRAGQVDRAMDMVKTMPFQPPAAAWRSMLSACKKWDNVKLGRQAFECAVMLDKNDAAAYILMSNIYAAAHMEKEAKEIEALRVKSEAWKEPGQSWWTHASGVLHKFVVVEREQPECQDVYAALSDFFIKMKEEEGYVCHLDSMLQINSLQN